MQEWKRTKLTELLGLEYPIIQAPMAGGATSAELVASVSNSGGLGSLGAGYMPAGEIREAIYKISHLTKKPFAVNLFIPEFFDVTSDQLQMACSSINQCARDLNINIEPPQEPYVESFEEQIQVLLEEKISVFSFTFGVLEPCFVEQFKANGTFIIGTATTLAEACMLQASGVDAIAVQGIEAGGHRGSFLDEEEPSLLTLSQLLDELIEKINVPIIASGGIMTGHQIRKAICSGAAATQLGTAFLCTNESGIHHAYKELLLRQTKDNTVLTRAFSGKMARGIHNKFIECMELKPDTILAYPIQNTLTALMRKEARLQANSDFMSLWAGQSGHLARSLDACSLFAALIREADEFV